MSENDLFHEIKRDGITSLHGIHVQLFVNKARNQLLLLPDFWKLEGQGQTGALFSHIFWHGSKFPICRIVYKAKLQLS